MGDPKTAKVLQSEDERACLPSREHEDRRLTVDTKRDVVRVEGGGAPILPRVWASTRVSGGVVGLEVGRSGKGVGGVEGGDGRSEEEA